MGLISGYLIGLATDYYTSNSHSPVQEMAEKCQSGAAINIIYGLAVGYLSTIIPIILLILIQGSLRLTNNTNTEDSYRYRHRPEDSYRYRYHY